MAICAGPGAESMIPMGPFQLKRFCDSKLMETFTMTWGERFKPSTMCGVKEELLLCDPTLPGDSKHLTLLLLC